MSKIKFYGTAGMVTGSSFLLTAENGETILIDLGMFQDENYLELNYQAFDYDVSKLSGVILTHAHLDHCGRLPLLTKFNFKGKIYMTKATRMLTELSLLDSAKIAEENKDKPPIYSVEDVEKIMRHVEEVEYGKQFDIGPYEGILRDAGHILGSASIEIKERNSEKSIVFSGDLGNNSAGLTKPTEKIHSSSTVVMESTYGDKDHPVENASEIIADEIQKIEKLGGVLLIPAFSIERSQEVLYKIDHLKKQGKVKQDTLVFLDSPMAIKATEIFRQFRYLLNTEIVKQKDDPFDFPGLSLVEQPYESKKILKIDGPKVIIAGSGMMNGGRILHHGLNYLSKATTRLLIVGFMAKGTLGRQIADGAKKVKILDREIEVNAAIRQIHSMSSHAGQTELLNWLGGIKNVEKVFIVHGDEETRIIFADKIKESLNISDIILPEMNQEFEI